MKEKLLYVLARSLVYVKYLWRLIDLLFILLPVCYMNIHWIISRVVELLKIVIKALSVTDNINTLKLKKWWNKINLDHYQLGRIYSLQFIYLFNILDIMILLINLKGFHKHHFVVVLLMKFYWPKYFFYTWIVHDFGLFAVVRFSH